MSEFKDFLKLEYFKNKEFSFSTTNKLYFIA